MNNFLMKTPPPDEAAITRRVLEEIMKTRCKFRCAHATPKDAQGPHTATFEVVIDGSPENKSFFAATPAGSLTLSVVREQHFEAGKDYYLDLSPAD